MLKFYELNHFQMKKTLQSKNFKQIYGLSAVGVILLIQFIDEEAHFLYIQLLLAGSVLLLAILLAYWDKKEA